MTIEISAGAEPQVDILAATEGLLRDAAGDLSTAIQAMRDGRTDEAKAAIQAVKDLKTAFQMVMDERTRVEKLRRQVTGAVGAQALDIAAARDEIGKRLARLRDAG
jgi:hypothetical protein